LASARVMQETTYPTNILAECRIQFVSPAEFILLSLT